MDGRMVSTMNSISGDDARPATSGLAASAAWNCAADQWSMFSSLLAANFSTYACVCSLLNGATNTCATRSRSASFELLTCGAMHLATSTCRECVLVAVSQQYTGLGQEAEPRSHDEHAVRGPRLQVAIVEQVEVAQPELVQPVEYEQEPILIDRWAFGVELTAENF